MLQSGKKEVLNHVNISFCIYGNCYAVLVKAKNTDQLHQNVQHQTYSPSLTVQRSLMDFFGVLFCPVTTTVTVKIPYLLKMSFIRHHQTLNFSFINKLK